MNKKDEIKSEFSNDEITSLINAKLVSRGITNIDSVNEEALYQATVLVLKDFLITKRAVFKEEYKRKKSKKICYLCMEFLVGRSLKTVSDALGIYEALSLAIKNFGYNFEDIYSIEKDPGLGNGGLGRLAACFMDSL